MGRIKENKGEVKEMWKVSQRNVRERSEGDKITGVIKDRKNDVEIEERQNLFFPQHTSLSYERKFTLIWSIFSDIVRYYEILSDIMRYCEILWDIMRYYEILWDIMRYCEILWDIARYCEILWDIVIYFKILWDIMRYYEILWDIMRYYEILWDIMRYYEIFPLLKFAICLVNF